MGSEMCIRDRLNTVSTYYDLVPAFLALLQQQDNDFEAFYAEVKRIGKMPKPERRAYLEGLMSEKIAAL